MSTVQRRAFSLVEVAEQLGFPTGPKGSRARETGRKRVLRLIHDHKLPAVRIGKEYRVTGDALDALLRGEAGAA